VALTSRQKASTRAFQSSGASWKADGFLFHNLELGSWDQLGDGAAELRAAGRVEPAGEDERGRGDLRGGALGPA
jgi:hypothetical protein